MKRDDKQTDGRPQRQPASESSTEQGNALTMVDRRPGATAQRQLMEAIAKSPRALLASPVAQRQDVEEELPLQGRFEAPAQRREAEPAEPNRTGLPDGLKAGIESMSGLSMDHVRVHYGSSRPAQLNALAYAQGSEIHVAPGQERHLPHEAWHVVQQAQGRVRPTAQMKGGAAINDDPSLEAEADEMGRRALQRYPGRPAAATTPEPTKQTMTLSARGPVQRVLGHNQPIVGNDVASVARVGGKLVYIVTGTPGNGRVVVKFETFGASESLAEYGDRSRVLRDLAATVLQNVPGSARLTPADMAAIAQIPAAIGGDVADLQQMAAGVLNGAQGYDRLLALKMQHMDVGQNLEHMADHGPQVSLEPALWREFGRMAAFDMLVSNNDRFNPDGVNLENVDVRALQGVSLDVVDSNSPLKSALPWEGWAIYRDPAAWSLKTVGEMCDRFGVLPLYFHSLLDAFRTGFAQAKATLAAQEPALRAQGPRLQGRGQAATGIKACGYIATRLRMP